MTKIFNFDYFFSQAFCAQEMTPYKEKRFYLSVKNSTLWLLGAESIIILELNWIMKLMKYYVYKRALSPKKMCDGDTMVE
jgi:hypothetical protein